MKEKMEKLKEEFLEHLETMDKSKMSVYDLIAYADLLRKTDELFKPSYPEVMANFASSIGCLCKRGDNDG